MMVFIRFWRSLTKKDSVKSARYDIKHFFLLLLKFWDIFFTDPNQYLFFRIGSGFLADPDFWPIRTQKKISDSDPEKNPESETLLKF